MINNGDGTITVLAGTTSFTASVPIIDDDIIEATETASIQIGEAKGIAQIFDNDGETKPFVELRLQPQLKILACFCCCE